MMHSVRVLFVGWMLTGVAAFAGTVNVADSFVGSMSRTETVEPKRFNVVPLGDWVANDELAIQIRANNKVFGDITACIVNEDEARNYQPGGACRGTQKGVTPYAFKWRVEQGGKYFLVLDNTYAGLIKKSLVIDVRYKKTLAPQQVANLKSLFDGIHAKISNDFENADFNIHVKPCGQSNAFSERESADITICSEIISDLGGNPGALVAVVLHEYGHSLLNRWGEPGSSEEDMADQFATAILLKAGDKGREFLQSWIQFWMQRNSRAEAENQLYRGDTHTLSIQRARNIQNAINFPDDLMRRWNKMFYHHMKKDALVKAINAPQRMDDVDLAKVALQSK